MILINYLDYDNLKADRIAFEMEMRGLKVALCPWKDGQDLSLLSAKIISSSCFITIFSKSSLLQVETLNEQLAETLSRNNLFTGRILVVPVSLDGSMTNHSKLSELMIMDFSSNWQYGIDKLIDSLNIKIKKIRPKIELSGTRWHAVYNVHRHERHHIIYDFCDNGLLLYSNDQREQNYRLAEHDPTEGKNGYGFENIPFSAGGRWSIYGNQVFLKEANNRYFKGKIQRGKIIGSLRTYFSNYDVSITFKFSPGVRFSDFWGE